MFWKIFRACSAVGALVGLVYVPADIYGICEAYPKTCGIVAGMDRFTLLAIFSAILVFWSLYRDWREPWRQFLAWRRGKRGLFTVSSLEVVNYLGLKRPKITLRFHKPVRQIKITMKVRSGIGSKNEAVNFAGEVIFEDVLDNQEVSFPLGAFHVRSSIARHEILTARWGLGDILEKTIPASIGTTNVIILKVNGREHRVMIKVTDSGGLIMFDQDDAWIPILLRSAG